MTEHYFTSDPSVKSNMFSFAYTLRGAEFTFFSDQGVFSKNEVDFGTRLLVEAYEMPNVTGPVLDVGCGYGPIGLTIATEHNDREVYMVDVNERALELAKKNSQANKIDNVTIFKSYLFEAVKEKQFAAIISNPPIRAGKSVVHELFEKAYDYLADDGELWIVIQKKQGAPSAIEKLKSMFSEVEVVVKKKGYYIIKSKKS